MQIMSKYSIKELSHLTGIQAHTLRVWELRYKALLPNRTITNIRLYSDEDLKKVLNISLLTKYGLRIGNILKMGNKEIQEYISKINSIALIYETQINNLINIMVDFDEQKFDKLFNTLLLRYGFENTLIYIISPFLERIGILWISGNSTTAQEHFITNLIRQKTIVAIDAQIKNENPNGKSFLLCLPENEWHELSLLFLNLLLKNHGHKVYYIGASVPLANIIETIKYLTPDFIFMIITNNIPTKNLQSFFNSLGNEVPDFKFLFSGSRIANIDFEIAKNIQLLTNYCQIKDFIDNKI